ncbi:hypothetical protein CICLE_v10013189mg [Citrus x clementina]|uniref:Complex III subunit 9 n=1 Tax=Citrus clementina TaxID=85681 RepID=V4SWM4_CITCL|nr:hypothetical protein CICLE_v10013189mg [Citrus x clementina]
MEYTTKRSQGGLLEGLYRVIMRRNSIYVTFIIAGAFAGERAVDYGVRKIWEHNNVGVICLQLSYLFIYAHKLLVLIFQMEYTTYVCLRCWSLQICFLLL